MPKPEWEQCEDCLGTGYNCSCHGGRRPANTAASKVVAESDKHRQQAAYEQAERDLED